jgi:dihydropteroate synthase
MTSNARAQRLDQLFGLLADKTTPPAIMGVLNVTPDSFSDGAHFIDPQRAVRHALQMIAEGADVIDIGPESTRPGSQPVPTQEQIARAIPVIKELRRANTETLISIDTRDTQVARAAIDAGADLVNDVSALRADESMADMLAGCGAGVVLMHMLGTPATMQTADGGPTYESVVVEIRDFLRQRIEFAVACGIRRDRILIDPGIGFGKTVEHNLELLRRLDAFAELGVPLLVGASRKNFIGKITGIEEPAERLAGSLACATIAVLHGAATIRVHDVAPSLQAVTMAHALRPPAG